MYTLVICSRAGIVAEKRTRPAQAAIWRGIAAPSANTKIGRTITTRCAPRRNCGRLKCPHRTPVSPQRQSWRPPHRLPIRVRWNSKSDTRKRWGESRNSRFMNAYIFLIISTQKILSKPLYNRYMNVFNQYVVTVHFLVVLFHYVLWKTISIEWKVSFLGGILGNIRLLSTTTQNRVHSSLIC